MPVVVDGFDVVVRNTTLEGRFPGGLYAFASIHPATYCTDGILSRIGYLNLTDARLCLDFLEAKGLRVSLGDQAIDAVVVNAVFGCSARCDWIALGEYDHVTVAWHPGARPAMIAVPSGWSRHQKLEYMSESEARKRLVFVRTQGNFDTYLDRTTGREVNIQRSPHFQIGALAMDIRP